MLDSQYWKECGNQSFRTGKFEEAIHAYSRALEDTADSDAVLRSTILSNRSTAFHSLGSFQLACRDAREALHVKPDNEKARYRHSKALFQLRSYQTALDELRPIVSSNDPNIQFLLRQLTTCVAENRHGQFDIFTIKKESQLNPRLSHADYCSGLIGLSKSEMVAKPAAECLPRKTSPRERYSSRQKQFAAHSQMSLKHRDHLLCRICLKHPTTVSPAE